MKVEKSQITINPINQLNLFGYEHYFDFFEKLYKNFENNLERHNLLIDGGISSTVILSASNIPFDVKHNCCPFQNALPVSHSSLRISNC